VAGADRIERFVLGNGSIAQLGLARARHAKEGLNKSTDSAGGRW